MASNPERPYLTALSCRSTLQRNSLEEATSVLRRVTETYTLDGTSVFSEMRTPPETPPAWRLSRAAQRMLRIRPPLDPAVPARAWTKERGRISSPEYQALVGASSPTAVKQLKEFAAAEGLVPSSPSGKGRGFHFVDPEWLQSQALQTTALFFFDEKLSKRRNEPILNFLRSLN